ncbi:dienelactone hydrolase family protein [Kitasatospora purpeofusca]|uniref:dienelactone hydrolase family protein n=1 Tax=Kitasatospora purpeofusca TaxID=67352 RepID=UPI002A5A2830|nr:dienelactone hydrolase family protein [Kitasatospora purpeofusca]MDY0813576.1 alpha/beta fold hydrolase [Kitasatospora purpeofusca]
MCHPTDSRPPAAPVVTGTVAEEGRSEITAADGNRFSAFRAAPSVPNGRSILLLPDRRGLHPFYEDLARRFAEAGFHVMAFDFYGRSAGLSPRDADFDWAVHMPLLEPAHVEADAAAALTELREWSDDPVFGVGFCLGGSYSWRLAAADLGLAGAAGFYGVPRFFGDRTEQLTAPLLMLLAGEDVVTTREEFAEFTGGLERAGKEYEMKVYEGAPHSFFDDSAEDWSDACTDAWHRLLAFTGVRALTSTA